MRTIKVTGKGNLKVKPDMTRVTMTLEGVYPEYEETLQKSTQDTECLKEVLGKLGFAKSDLKTLSFNVDTKQENYRVKHNEWKQCLAWKSAVCFSKRTGSAGIPPELYCKGQGKDKE